MGEENNHYTGKVEKYEDGTVVFRLDYKIGERRKKGKIRNLLLNDGDFYIACGIDSEKGDRIKIGERYNLDRRYLLRAAREILEKRRINVKDKKSGSSIDDEINLEGIEIGREITETGIADLLMKDDEKDED